MRALITGIEGFVGPYLAAELLGAGYQVAGAHFAACPPLEGVTRLYKADVRRKEELRAVLAQAGPDVVFHLAALSDAGASFANARAFMDVNAGGTAALLEAIQEEGLGSRVLLAGSAHEYGIPVALPVREDHPLVANSPYGVSKVEAERIARRFPDRVLMTRSFNHTGPGQPSNFVLSSFARQIARIASGAQAPRIIVGDTSVERDFLDVRDVVRAYRLLVERGVPGEAYNVCSGKGYVLERLLRTMGELAGIRFETASDTARIRPSEIPALIGNNSKLAAATGWTPAVALETTLRDMIEWWRRHA